MMVTANVRLVRRLGQGGMGSIWVGHHGGLDTEVAVKFVASQLAQNNPDALRRFEREARAAAKIKSPHVVHTYDHGVMQSGVPYIVMELLQGESLGDRLERGKALKLRETAIVVQHIAKALTQAHKLGIVHRDIKPDNVFLVAHDDDDPFVKVLDFGIAKNQSLPSDNVTATGALLGTPRYMSPEQLRSTKSAGPSADLWALAVVAYEAMVGKPPFVGDTLATLILAITSVDFAPPSSVKHLRPALDSWFARALDPEPEARFGTAKELARSFWRAAVDEAAVSPGSQPSEDPVDAPDDEQPAEHGAQASDAEAETGQFVLDRALDVLPESARSVEETASPRPSPSDEDGKEDTKVSPQTVQAKSAALDSAAAAAAQPAGRKSRARWIGLLVVAALAAIGGVWLPRAGVDEAPVEALQPAIPEFSPQRPRPQFASRGIPAGVLSDSKAWLPAFDIAVTNDKGKDYFGSLQRCRKQGRWLCTDVQWTRACAVDPEVGMLEAWTLSVEKGGVVVRGGGGGCKGRQLRPATERVEYREVVCCDRAIALQSSNRNASFRKAATHKLAKYEKALASRNAAKLGLLVDEQVLVRGKTMSRRRFVSQASAYFRKYPGQWVVHERCHTRLTEIGWLAQCDALAQREGKIAKVVHIFERGGEEGLVQRFDETKIVQAYAPPGGSTKNRP